MKTPPRGTSTPNPFAAARRRRKAKAVARLIWSQLTIAEKRNPALPETVAAMDQGTRDGWAFEAKVPVLSPESWQLVVAEIQEKVETERWYAGKLDDSRASA